MNFAEYEDVDVNVMCHNRGFLQNDMILNFSESWYFSMSDGYVFKD